MKLGRWTGLGQGSLLDSMTPVLLSSIPLTLGLLRSSPALHPFLTHLYPPSPAAVHFSPQNQKCQESLWLTQERTQRPGKTQTPQEAPGEKGWDLGEGQSWPEGWKLQGQFYLLIESSQAPTCPVFLIPPPAWNAPWVPGSQATQQVLTLGNKFQRSPSWQSRFLVQNP